MERAGRPRSGRDQAQGLWALRGREINLTTAPPSFPNLWVFDLRFTKYVYLPQVAEMMRDLRELNAKGVSWNIINQAWKRLQNLKKLRVRAYSSEAMTVDSCSPIDLMNLELLDLSGTTQLKSLPDLSLAQRLKLLVLDGCSSLERVMIGRAPMLESFSFDGFGQAKKWTHSLHLALQELRPRTIVYEAKVSKISLNVCARLHSIFLRALPNLQELNLSGTAIERLDLGAMDIRSLKYLFLLGCEKLRSLWWDGNNPTLEGLHVDTWGEPSLVLCCGEQKNFKFVADITFLDGRFVWSVMQGIYGRLFGRPGTCTVHLHISSTVDTQVHVANNIEDTVQNNGEYVATGPSLPAYMDVHFLEDVARSGLLWDCRQLKVSNLHLEIGEGSYNLERMQDVSYFCDFTNRYTQSLHVHDNISITAIPPSHASWANLEWCHVERCPKLQTLFTCPTSVKYTFSSLVTFSANDLPLAHCIWGEGINNQEKWAGLFYYFSGLRHIYLNNCPRLVYVLPVSFDLARLETIQIEYCSNIKIIFPLDDEYPEHIEDRVFELKRIKLRHLHNMEQICGARVSDAPKLEMISVRDCWRLRRLPAISDRCSQRPIVRLRRLPAISDRCSQRPIVDGEKDWWDKLEWDGLKANHHPPRFETHLSRCCYKKTIPRVSVLR